MGQVAGASPIGGAKYVKYTRRLLVKSGSSTMSCSPCAATDFTGGTPSSGADTMPPGLTMRIVPLFWETRMLPSGRKATAQAPVSPPASVSTVNPVDRVAGGG